jgi:hypothetical protein
MEDINKANMFMSAEYNVVDTEYFILFKEKRMNPPQTYIDAMQNELDSRENDEEFEKDFELDEEYNYAEKHFEVGDKVKFDFYENDNLKHVFGRVQSIEHNILCTGLVMTNSIKIIVND